jgi:hypothetical protein
LINKFKNNSANLRYDAYKIYPYGMARYKNKASIRITEYHYNITA